jgi:hypothetical protein
MKSNFTDNNVLLPQKLSVGRTIFVGTRQERELRLGRAGQEERRKGKGKGKFFGIVLERELCLDRVFGR